MARSIQSSDMSDDPYAGAMDVVSLYSGLPPIDQVTVNEFKDRAEFEKFMQDRLVISVHSTGDPNEPTYAYVSSNGKKAWLPRDRKVTMTREMVSVLAQSSSRSFKTVTVHDPDAIEGTRVETRSAQCYPFELIHDPHPRGREWLARFMRQSSV